MLDLLIMVNRRSGIGVGDTRVINLPEDVGKDSENLLHSAGR